MKKLFNIIFAIVIAATISSCTRIDAGHVGLKINMTSSSKGVQDVTETTGWVFYAPWLTVIEEFPTYTQTCDYDAFTITTKDAAQFSVDPTLNYSPIRTQIPTIYVQYRKPLKEIEVTIIRNIVYDAYRITANKYSSDSIMSNRGKFEAEAESYLTNALLKDGFKFERITSNLHPPKSLQDMIDAKNRSIQVALKAENDVKTAEANAKIAVAEANGKAQAQIAEAKGDFEAAKFEAAANRERQSAYTDNFIKYQYLKTWNGQLPQYILGSNTSMLMQMPK
jgi:regulator of protease activity HflC (stomatin/prohibitin superfamily)